MRSVLGILLMTAAGWAANGVGEPKAPILIEVFSDFQCPGCKTLHEQTLKPLARDYVSAGKVYLLHREFPLPGHAFARQAAEYACAAGRIGRYERVADALFARQTSWSASGKVEDAVVSVLTPEEARKVRALAKDPETAAAIGKDLAAGQAAGLRQTPTMVITHRLKRYPLSGNVSYDLLRRFLNDLLAK